MSITYTTWFNEEEAKKAEEFLVNTLIEAQKLTPSRRDRFYDHAFFQFRGMMGIEHSADDDLVVYTNINPLLALLKADRADIVLKAYKDNLPLCGDGYLKAQKPKHKSLANRLYFVPNSKLPICEDSLFHRGHESPFFALESIKDVNTLAKCYSGMNGFSSEYVQQCVNHLSSPMTNLDNALALFDRAFSGTKLVLASKRVAGLDTLLESEESSPTDEALSEFVQSVKGDDRRLQHMNILLGYLNDTSARPLAITDLCANGFSSGRERPFQIKCFVDNLVALEKIFAQTFPDKARGLKIRLIKAVAEFNYGFEGNIEMLDELKAHFSEADIMSEATARDVDFFVKRFGYTGLIEKASNEYKADLLEDVLGM